MNKNSLIGKGLAFAVIILLISITFASGINANNDTFTVSNQNKCSRKSIGEELYESRHIDISLRYRYISEDGQIHTVTKSRSELMDERTKYYEEEELPIISHNIGDGNHPPIIIDGNDDFTSENGVTGGNGTEEDPYVIEDWIIVGDGSARQGILVNNTDVHFIIRNCTINGFHHPYEYFYGIKFQNVENGNVESSKLYENHLGINVKFSSYIRIDNCICYDYPVLYAYGINCYYSTHVNISSCECYNMYEGVSASHCSDITIKDSEIYNNLYTGIDCHGIDTKTKRIKVINCSVYNNQHNGIWIQDYERHPSYSIISGCDIYNNGDSYQGLGINLQRISNNIIENCNIYSNNAGGIAFENSNNILRNCSIFNHTDDTNLMTPGVIVHGWILYGEFSWNNTIINCDIYNNEIGISLVSTFGITIEKNNIFNNSWYGMLSFQFTFGKISDNNFLNNGFIQPENNTCGVAAILSFLDMRNNWWDAEDGPRVYVGGLRNIFPIRLRGSGETIIRVLSPVLYRPWATEPIPDAGVQ